ncbi:MAG TPA: C2 family cysteine protease [Pirellulales bacterium]|jgi:hypothetical protein|nr:C2 family cysteine protease [Pirellulales bacterium]
MFRLFNSLSHPTRTSKPTSHAARRPHRLGFESLEKREMMTGETLITFPAVPTPAPASSTLTATEVSGLQIGLRWTPEPTVTFYTVNQLINGAWQEIGRFAPNVTGDDVNENAGETCDFDVEAFNAGGESVSNIAQATIYTAPASPNDWFWQHLPDLEVQNLARTDFDAHGTLNYSDMVNIFSAVQNAGDVTTNEFNSLVQIADNPAQLNLSPAIASLTASYVNGNVANAQYNGAPMGNLAVGSSPTQQNELLGKWFLGLDSPSTALPANAAQIGDSWGPTTYQLAEGQLWGPSGGPQYSDVNQGYDADCYFLSALAETALVDPQAIKNMITPNNNGTYTVRFFDNGTPEYVTVNQYLPVSTPGGNFEFDGVQSANNASNVLWVELAEKAYAQVAEEGWSRSYMTLWNGINVSNVVDTNSYAAIAYGNPGLALSQITGLSWSQVTGVQSTGLPTQPLSTSNLAFNTVVADYNAGDLLAASTINSPSDGQVAADHCYAIQSVDASSQTITLFNPWGMNNTSGKPGMVTLTWAQFEANYQQFTNTSSATAGGSQGGTSLRVIYVERAVTTFANNSNSSNQDSNSTAHHDSIVPLNYFGPNATQTAQFTTEPVITTVVDPQTRQASARHAIFSNWGDATD